VDGYCREQLLCSLIPAFSRWEKEGFRPRWAMRDCCGRRHDGWQRAKCVGGCPLSQRERVRVREKIFKAADELRSAVALKHSAAACEISAVLEASSEAKQVSSEAGKVCSGVAAAVSGAAEAIPAVGEQISAAEDAKTTAGGAFLTAEDAK